MRDNPVEGAVIPTGQLFECYYMYCRQKQVIPATTTCIGQVLFRVSKTVRYLPRRRVGNRGPCYSSCRLVSDAEKNSTNVTIPSFISASLQNNIYSLSIPKNTTLDGEVVKFHFKLNLVNSTMTLNILDKDIDIVKYGLSNYGTLNQMWLDGLITITDTMKLCTGIPDNSQYESEYKLRHVWNSLLGSKENDKIRSHGKRCSVILPFCTPHSCTHCANCANDIKELNKRIQAKMESTSQSESDTSDSDGEDSSNEEEKYIKLSEMDHNDLIEIIRKLLPQAPEFCTLLQSQLKNASNTEKDARYRRWSPEMISLCLNLWGK